ncbi:Lrp/AsnC family transcriptional regulator [Roseobacter denitrificans]|uniref:siroheme decarboxylase n=1 Tax=Roseobacter denitrificans (strain ATCC 33942 / OCh 114) TaxID=375451 RepID=Q169Z4_ROSDO|nr:Lrp/AsnC family transcriptional regulator [Roseobacter denitrificans]ABG31199.1 nitrite reductase heme biosynthesis H protein, putative [Roseobacter denitrificans OCh 114]AVL54257.1 Lrp/AsnC family transcriptional regulator [Roseobacter denitrificans]SFF97871.1 transcriptional regulator, AsnC family [Roseobacter denitrificans OCh 114]
MSISPQDRALIKACQAGLPLVPEPYAQIAKQLDMTQADVMNRLEVLLGQGVIRRVGIAPNHYKLGMAANGMTVWDIDDAQAEELGALVGAMEDVTHCYLRPRKRPVWPYNLFAMLHGSTRDEVEEKRQHIVQLLGSAVRAHDVLYSTQILKKTGLRLASKGAT